MAAAGASISSQAFLKGRRSDGGFGLGFSPSDLGGLSSPAVVQICLRRLPHPSRRLEVKAIGNVFGNYFKVATYGESHGGGVGCTISGCPPRLPLSEADMQAELDRRRPGQSRITTPRKETDTCKILSGISEVLVCTDQGAEWGDTICAGMTTGTPIHVFVPNTDQRSHDYSEMSIAYRPSHADATYDFKYGIRSVQGGGRSSARETIGRVAAGAVAKKILRIKSGVEILAYVSQVHKVVLPDGVIDYDSVTVDQIESNIVRCPDPEYAQKMIDAIDAVRVKGDSVGGVVTCIARNVPRGLGSPVFDKLEAEFAKAMMSLPATRGVEFGSGFSGALMMGSQHNDEFYTDDNGIIRTRTNRSGGIQKKQNTVTRNREETELLARGRHDPCVLPRAVPMVEAMAALVLVDQLMAQIAQCEMFPINLDLQRSVAEPINGSVKVPSV
ncbi:Chorismate synthase, chloroplastic [Dendrobium catenatum]|uniref:Chorismate synthase n=1 Tax=Dendrobium catenatum TaxID=906689 RepID=A0A2I0VBW9_9ASPA|nr:Chorismate synthase, chloroplastic [Dendrobium catenatum]